MFTGATAFIHRCRPPIVSNPGLSITCSLFSRNYCVRLHRLSPSLFRNSLVTNVDGMSWFGCNDLGARPAFSSLLMSDSTSLLSFNMTLPEFYKKDLSVNRLRNIGMIAHIDAGKTTATERIVFYAGLISRLGNVDDGNTVMDYMDQERERGITITSATIAIPWLLGRPACLGSGAGKSSPDMDGKIEHGSKGSLYRINLIDTPGHVDFTMEVQRALRVLDGVIILLDARKGIEAQTETVWKQAKDLPKIIFVNKMDKEDIHFSNVLKKIQKRMELLQSGAKILPLQVPIIGDDWCNTYPENNTNRSIYLDESRHSVNQDKMGTSSGCLSDLKTKFHPAVSSYYVIDLLDLSLIEWRDSNGLEMNRYSLSDYWDLPIRNEKRTMIISLYNNLLETLAEHDESLFELYLEHHVTPEDDASVLERKLKEFPKVQLIALLRKLTLERRILPLFCGAAGKNWGIQPLVDAVVHYLPSPQDVSNPILLHTSGRHIPLRRGTFVETTLDLDTNHALASVAQQTLNLDQTNREVTVALAFKVLVDPQRGPLVFVRLYSGTIPSKGLLFNVQTQSLERITKIVQLIADDPIQIDSLTTGNIGVLLGCKKTKTGDTLILASEKKVKLQSLGNELLNAAVNDVIDSELKEGTTAIASADNATVSKNVASALNFPLLEECQLKGIPIPPAVFFCSVEPDSLKEEPHLLSCLTNLSLEDPSFRYEKSTETGQWIMSGMGELHLDILKHRLVHELNCHAQFGALRIAYRETIPDDIPLENDLVVCRDHMGKRQHLGIAFTLTKMDNTNGVTGTNIRADVPNAHTSPVGPAESNFLGENKITISNDIVLPLRLLSSLGMTHAAFIDAIQVQCIDSLKRGPLLGFPMINLHFLLRRLDLFPDTTMPAVHAVLHEAIQSVLREHSAEMILLEPLMKVNLRIRKDSLGAVLSDINAARRGHITHLVSEMNQAENVSPSTSSGTLSENTVPSSELEYHLAEAEIPLAQLIGYSSTLRSLSSGTASFTMETQGFRPLPAHLQASILLELRGY